RRTLPGRRRAAPERSSDLLEIELRAVLLQRLAYQADQPQRILRGLAARADDDADVVSLRVGVELAQLPVQHEAGVRVELLLQEPDRARQEPLAAVDVDVQAEFALACVLADLVDLRRRRQHFQIPSTAMPAWSARATSSDRSSTSVVPVSTAKAAHLATAQASMVAGPTVGTSKRSSCCGLRAFTTTAPGAKAPPRAMQASVPSTASTARMTPRLTTTVCPTSARPSARAAANPADASSRCSSFLCRFPSRPCGASSPGTSGSGETMRIPSSSSAAAIARSAVSSPPPRSRA